MSGKSRVRTGRWRWWLAGAFGVGLEAWLLLTPELKMNGAAFEVLCALSCWLPAWCCADLLSTPRSDTAIHREWSVREVLRRAALRLLPALLLLALWCGTFILRSLQAELKLPAPRFMPNISEPEALVPVWIAWTTVFVVSGFAYGTAAGLCSALARRPRRWLITPAVVVGASQFLTLALWLLGFQNTGSPPYGQGLPLADTVRQVLTFPNYTLGSIAALLTVNELSERQEPLFHWLSQFVPAGIAIFCWIASFFFGLLGTACAFGIFWIARNRHRRHPNTVLHAVTGDQPERCAPQPG